MRKLSLNIFVAFCVFMMALTGPGADGATLTVDDDGPAHFSSIQAAIDDTGTVASELHDMAFVITGPEPSRERFEPISFTYSTATGFGTIAGILDARACGGPSEVYFEATMPVPAIMDSNPALTPAGAALGTITEATGSHNDQGKTVGIYWSGLGPVTLTGTAGGTTYTVDVELIFGPSGDEGYNDPDEDLLSSYDPLGEDYVYTWTIEISDDALTAHGGDAVSPGGDDNPRMAVYLAVGREEANGGSHRFTQVERQFNVGPDAYINNDGTTGFTKWSKFAAYQDLGIYYGWRDGSDIGGGSFQIDVIVFGGNLLVDTDNIIPEPGIIFVDADAAVGGDGSSWADAYNFLQDALADSAASGKKIFVAEGIYKPDQTTANPGGTGDRLATFQLINDVGVYGGFPSGGGMWDQRDPDAYETILSGDLNGDDGPDFANNGENSYHVVTGSGTDATAILDGFTITGGNSANDGGGGMYNSGSSPTVTNCTFSGNSADFGGGMNNNNCSPKVTNCTFTGNSVQYFGGGMGNWNSSPIVTNCTFSGNEAGNYGGGMFNFTNSSPTVTNCTFSGNEAGNYYGGGMYNFNNSSPTVTNCILWGDSPDEIYNESSSAVITYSDVEGGYAGTGNIDADPCFVDDTNPDPNLWNLRLVPGSPCVDSGDNSAPNLPPTDLAGNPRVVDGDGDGTATADMGAFEFYRVLNITQGRWYEIIQTAIDAANDYDEIEVAPGTYNETINFNGKAIRLYSSGGPDVTNIDANGIYHVVQCISNEGPDTILEGFTITGGNATHGGGMYNSGSSPTVTDCTFTGNTVSVDGGGMYNRESSPTITNCTFSSNMSNWGAGMYNYTSNSTVTNCTFINNSASDSGGGMLNQNNSLPTVTDCTFSGNTATNVGGGMCNFGHGSSPSSPTVTNCTFTNNSAGIGGGMYSQDSSSPTVTNCTFSGNSAGLDGGGMYNDDSSPTVTNCILWSNSANYGGGMYNYNNSNPTMTNCTFGDNLANNYGGSIINNGSSSPTVTNCILWGNSPDEINDWDSPASTTTVSFSDVEGGWSGLGNIDADPCFVDPNHPDPNLVNLRLLPDSPCIDAGDNSAPGLPVTDLAGNRRIFDGNGDGNSVVDMGAYEFGSLNLLAHWKLDESSGGIAYDSSGDNHGTLEPTGPVWLPAGGQKGGALQFDGVDDFVDCGNDDSLNITDEITLALWVKTNDAGNGEHNPYVIKGDKSYGLKHQVGNNIEFFIYDDWWYFVWYLVDDSFNDDWYHLAGTYDGSELILYVDGIEVDRFDHTGSIANSTFNVNIGRNAEATDRLYEGLIDDVSIFSRALGGTEITQLKNNGGVSFISDPNMEALWELDESSGTTAFDSSGDNHGNLEPAPTPPVWQPAGGRLGGALEFDGFNDYVYIPNESRFDITYQVTVSAWIKVNAFDTDWQAIVTKGDSAWRLHRLQDTNSIAFHCNLYPDSWGAEGSINVNDGQWHHVAGVYDGTRAYLYVDGVLDNSEAASGLIWTNDYPVMIGENAEEPGRCWNGLIDDVRIYSAALGPSEVYQLYSNICYVDADAAGNNDGSSWTDAFNYLQDALAQAIIQGEIRVAEGTYKPDATSSNPSGTGDRTTAFGLEYGVVIKGGYAGFGQPDPNDRDVDAYQTVLSGDIGTVDNYTDNSYHVVTGSLTDATSILDGFTITGGNANGSFPHDSGAGMLNSGSSPTVTNCTFSENTASVRGSGMFNEENSNPTVTNCRFSNNSAGYGAGMRNNSSSPTVTNCTFSENTAGGEGGGMDNRYNSYPTVTNCTFSENSAYYGGGMYNTNSSPTVTDCTLSGNSASFGGGMYNRAGSSPTVTNCILWGDTPDEIFDSSSTTTVTYSDVQGAWPGTGNIDADPYFIDAATGNLRLRPGSPCIDAGDNSEPNLPATDLDGHPRIIDGDCDDIDVVDMGAYEFALAYIGDFDNNCSVDFFDFSIFAGAWMTQEGDPDWDWACDISDPPDDYIDWRDAAVLCDNWLAQIP